jgi:hypothetical protein
MNNLKVSEKSLDEYKSDNIICFKYINNSIVKRLTGKINIYLTNDNILYSELWFIISINDKIKLMTKNISRALTEYNKNDSYEVSIYNNLPYNNE